ncbi:MAG: glycosyltransferase [Clostridia bacterium]
MLNERINKPAIKIGEFVDSYYPVVDGVITVVDNYARRMNSDGNKCTVFTSKDKGYKNVFLPYDVVRCDSIALKENIYGVPLPFLDYGFYKKLRETDLDIVHIHSPAPVGWMGMNYAKEKDVPSIVSFHSKFYDHILKVVKADILTKIPMKVILETYEKADFVWACSKAAGEVLREYGYKGSYDVVDNGCEMEEHIFTEEERVEFDQKMGLEKGVPMFLFVGQIINHKNIKFSLDALKKAKEKGFKFKFVLVGTGYNFDEIKEYAEKIGLKNETSFLGSIHDREELSKIYSRADIFLFPSTYDNAPLVVMEASNCQTPAIVMKGSTTAEKIKDGFNGFITSDSVEEYAGKIVDSVKDIEKLKVIAKNAQETVGQSFDKVAENALERYRECIKLYRLTRK